MGRHYRSRHIEQRLPAQLSRLYCPGWRLKRPARQPTRKSSGKATRAKRRRQLRLRRNGPWRWHGRRCSVWSACRSACRSTRSRYRRGLIFLHRLRRKAHLHHLIITRRHPAHIHIADLRRAHNPRHQGDQQFATVIFFAFGTKKPAQAGDVVQARNAGHDAAGVQSRQAAQQGHFAFFHSHVFVDAPCTDDGLLQATHVDVVANVRHFDLDVHGDFLAAMDLRSQIDIDAHVGKLKLRAHQRTHPDRPHAGLKAARRIGILVTDLQGHLLAIERAHARVLQDARLPVVHHRVQQQARHVADGIVVGGDLAEFRKRKARIGCRGGGGRRGPRARRRRRAA